MVSIARRRVPNGDSVIATKTFVGEVWQDKVLLPTEDGTRANNVFFVPGARTIWHSHEGGQFLIVTSGSGLICTRGGEPESIEVGDMVWIPANEEHWHGGTATTSLAHLAISFGTTTYLEPITDDEFSAQPLPR